MSPRKPVPLPVPYTVKMARCTPILRKSKSQSDGHCPIWLRFSDTHHTIYASLGVTVHPRLWNEAKREVRKGHPQSELINALIQARLNDVEAERLRLLRDGEPVTAEALKAAVATPVTSASICFLAYVHDFLVEIESKGNIRRFKRERVVMNKLEAFAGSLLPFGKITPDFLRRFETHLLTEHRNKASTVQGNMTIIRLHLRRAMKEGIIPRDVDPFFAYAPAKAERPERHKLSERELAAIEALTLGNIGPSARQIARVRDVFLFSLYLAGIRFADIATMKVGNLTEEKGGLRLSYRMSKTGKRVTLRLIPQAERIARAYTTTEGGESKGADDFLFSMLQRYDLSTPRKRLNAISAQNTLHNKYLKMIAEKAEVKGILSFHVSRHSFADLARKRGWGIYEISKALAHSGLAITERYLAGFDDELVDSKMSALFANGDE